MAIVATGELAVTPDLKGFESKLSSGIGGIAKRAAATFGGIFAAQKAFSFGGDIIKEASDLNESINAVNVTFGKAAGGIANLGEKAATSLGLSRNEFNALAVRFSSFAGQIAGPGGDVVGVIDKLTKRGSDFASVMNLEVNEALQLFQSGLAGESEPLRKFGLDLSAAAVESFAYANGIAKTGEKLTEAQKVQARYQLILKQTDKTQGDFANTSDGLANAQRILGAQFDNLKAKLGENLLPVLAKATSFLSENLGPAMSRIGEVLRPVIDNVKAFAATLVSGFTADEGTKVEGLALSFREVFEAVRDLYEDQIKPLAKFFVTSVVPAIAAVGEKLVELVGFFARNIDTIKKVAAVIAVLLIPHWVALGVAATVSAAQQVAAWVVTKAQAIASMFAQSAQIAMFIGRLAALAISAAITAAAVVASWIAQAAAAVANAAIIAASWVVAYLPIIAFVAIVAGAVLLIIRHWDTIKEAAASVGRFITDRFTEVVDFFRGMPGKISSAASGMWDGIKNAFKSAINFIIRGWNRLEFKVPSFSAFGQTIGGFTLGVPDIPTLHSGGEFHAPFGQREGLALLRSGETVLTPGQAANLGGINVSVIVNGQATAEQAYAAGRAAGRGIQDEMERTALRRAARAR